MQPINHGTPYAYSYHGCRCYACVHKHRERAKQRMAEKVLAGVCNRCSLPALPYTRYCTKHTNIGK